MTLKHRLLQFGIGALTFAPLPTFAKKCTNNAQSQGFSAATGGAECNDTALSGNVGQLVDTLFIVIGAISVIIIIIGGIYYVTSTGDQARIKRAKDTILYAIIGLIVAILAYAIVNFVNKSF